MLEDDSGICPFTDRIPDRLAERARAFRPLAVGLRVSGVRHHTPVVEHAAIDHADGAVLYAERSLALVGDDGDGASAFRTCDLERHAAKPARASPDEDDVLWLDHVRFPSHQHPIGGRSAKQEASRLFPREPPRFRNALVALRPGKLTVAAVVRLISPDACALSTHRITAGKDPRIIGLPPAAVND